MQGQPAGLFAVSSGQEDILTNRTLLLSRYNQQNQEEKNVYFQTMCNISSLLHVEYPQNTTFHDHFVVRYLNKYRDVGMDHHFTVGNWYVTNV